MCDTGLLSLSLVSLALSQRTFLYESIAIQVDTALPTQYFRLPFVVLLLI